MRIKAIGFVFLNVSDFRRSVHFYTEILGLKQTHEYKGSWAEFDAGNVTLAIGVYGKGPSPKQRGNSTAVAFAVDDVEKAVAFLKRKGVVVVLPIKEHGVCFMAMVVDPDGNELILHKRKDNTAG